VVHRLRWALLTAEINLTRRKGKSVPPVNVILYVIQNVNMTLIARKAEPPDSPEPSGEDADEHTGEPDCILITLEPQSYERPAAPAPGALFEINILVSSNGFPCSRRLALTNRAGLDAITRSVRANSLARNARGRASA
jgi:hypothetical protein